MSWLVTNLCAGRRFGSPVRKQIVMFLADKASDDGSGIWCSKGTVARHSVRFSARELCVATNRQIGRDHYKRLENDFARLQGTQFVTNVRTGGKIETRIFSLIDEGGFVRTDDERFRLDYCEVKLSRWLMRAIASDQVVTISNDYFRLRRPLERRLYEITRKHCGNGPKWQIGLATLQNKTDNNDHIKRFRHNLREIIKADVTPFYRLELAIAIW